MERGEGRWVRFTADPANPHKMNKTRPAVIVSLNAANPNCKQPLVVPLSSKKDGLLGIHPSITATELPSQALCEQLMPIDSRNIQTCINKLSEQEQEELDKGMMQAIGCIQYYNRCKTLEKDNAELKQLVEKLKSALDGMQSELNIYKSTAVDTEALQLGTSLKSLLLGMRNIVDVSSRLDTILPKQNNADAADKASQPEQDIHTKKTKRRRGPSWAAEQKAEFVEYYKKYGREAAIQHYNISKSTAVTYFSRFKNK